MTQYVFDSYALLAFYWREPISPVVEHLIRSAEATLVTTVNVGEVFYRVQREEGETFAHDAMEWIHELGIAVVDVNEDLAVSAARIKADHPISYADCFAAALGKQVDAAVVTGDPEFEQLEAAGIVRVEWLPPKTRGRRKRR